MRDLPTYDLARILIRAATGEEYGDGLVVTDISWLDAAGFKDLGFVQWEPDNPQHYESGWHPGQNADPARISAEILERHPAAEIVFELDESSQFFIGFNAWVRNLSQPVSLSSGHFSTDTQAMDALRWLEDQHPEAYAAVRRAFPELDAIQWDGSWFDAEAMGVDAEWGSWLIDEIESSGHVYWKDGEPWGQ